MDVNSCCITLDFPGDFSAWHMTYSYRFRERHMIDPVPFSIPDGYPAVTNVSTFSSKRVPWLSEVMLNTELALSQLVSLQILFLFSPNHLECKNDGKRGILLTMVRKFRPFDTFFWVRSFFSMQTNSIRFSQWVC